MTGTDIAQTILALFGISFGIFSFVKIMKKNRRIDTESIAIVKDVQDLGRSDGSKVYAIKYDVKSSEPFELYETPCKKERKIGLQRTIFYEKADPKNNFYFKTIGQIDRRLFLPACFILFGLIILGGVVWNILI